MMDLQTPRDIKSLHERERRVIFRTILNKFRNDIRILGRNLAGTLSILSFLIRLSLQPGFLILRFDSDYFILQ